MQEAVEFAIAMGVNLRQPLPTLYPDMQPTVPWTVSWFSAGVSSALATKLAMKEGSVDEIIYCHIDDQHVDTLRFVKDCEAWFGQEIQIIQSPYLSVENAVRAKRYINRNSSNGTAGCSEILKKRLRKEWERCNQDKIITYVWGLDVTEKRRQVSIERAMPKVQHKFPLIEQVIDKTKAHAMLSAAGIKRPMMYDLGYLNNNCIGCVRGGMAYWNKIRVDFPEVFWARAALEREIGGTCLPNGQWLDALDPDRGREIKPICPECGVMCNFYRKQVT